MVLGQISKSCLFFVMVKINQKMELNDVLEQ